jgi:hypothetical protein
MNKSEVLWKNWKEMIHGMEMEIHVQTELINVQRADPLPGRSDQASGRTEEKTGNGRECPFKPMRKIGPDLYESAGRPGRIPGNVFWIAGKAIAGYKTGYTPSSTYREFFHEDQF